MQINNTTMNYESIYEGYYLKYYTKVEFFIKFFLVKRHSQKKTFGNSYNEVIHYLSNDFVKKHNLYANEKLEYAYRIFGKRRSIYFIDEVQEIFKNEIKIEFDKINAADLSANYTYNQFIKEVALIEAVREILRLFSNHERFYAMVYELNEFDKFEIKVYGNLALEDYPSFKILHSKLYSTNYTNAAVNTKDKEIVLDLKDHTKEVWFIVGCLIATGEMEILLQKHKSATQVAKILEIEKSRPYITDSKYNLKNNGFQNVERNTNIYNDYVKIFKIYNYCTQNKKSMTDDFIKIYNKIEHK
jgi:hypothetical protein